MYSMLLVEDPGVLVVLLCRATTSETVLLASKSEERDLAAIVVLAAGWVDRGAPGQRGWRGGESAQFQPLQRRLGW